MKIEFFENEYGTSFDLKPETPAEVAALIRIVQNTKSEKPEMCLYASGEPSMSIWIRKVMKVAQRNSISNKNSNS